MELRHLRCFIVLADGRRQLTWPVDDNYLGRLDLQPGRSGSEG